MSGQTSNYITTILELKHYLRIAIQLEHATIPPYLVALYSIIPPSNQEAVNVIRAVVVEEMLHLTMAVNLLNAVGGSPDLTYPGFVAKYPAYLPDGEKDFVVNRAAFSPEAIETFLNIERPARANRGKQNHTVDRKSTIINSNSGLDDKSNLALQFYSIGEFYDAIIEGFKYLDKHQKDELFTGDPSRQITPEYYYSSGGRIVPVYDLDSALAAMNEIIEQGEGARNSIEDEDHELAHYYRFEQLKLGRYYQAGDMPGAPSGEPLLVDWSGVYPLKKNAVGKDYPEGSHLRKASDAFNEFYAKFLADLTEAFNGKPQLLTTAVAGMFHLKSLIHDLVRNPIPGNEAFHGAPTFEVNLIQMESDVEPSPGDKKSEREPTSKPYYDFIDFSEVLTGFSAYQLYGTGQAETYFKAVQDVLSAELVEEMLHLFGDVASEAQDDANQLREGMQRTILGDPKFGPIARNILKLWYAGSWYQLPEAWREAYGERENDIDFVVSAESYTEGLLWPAVGANPSGAKPFGYGTWADPPKTT